MTYKIKTTDNWINYLLKNEYRIRVRQEMFLLTDKENSSINLGIVATKTGRENETKLVNKITNKNYVFRKMCLECIDKLYASMTIQEEDIMTLRFRHGYNAERVAYEVNYSKTTVNRFIKVQKDKLKKMVEEIESEVFKDELNKVS